jgi:hypothetical protein
MKVVECTDTFKRFEFNGNLYQMVWETNTITSPEGATVIVVNLSRPKGQREIFRKTGFDHELMQLIYEAEQAAEADSERYAERIA